MVHKHRKYWRLWASALCGATLWSALPAAEPERTSAYLGLVQQLRHAEQVFRDDLMVNAIERLQRIDPDSPEALLGQIQLALRQDQLGRAYELLHRLTNLRGPDDPNLRQALALLHLAERPDDTLLAEARLAAAMGDYANAVSLFDRALPEGLPNVTLAVESARLRANLPGGHASALTLLQPWAERYPSNAELLLTLGDLQLATAQPEAALRSWQRLAQQAPYRETATERELNYLETLAVSADLADQLQSFRQRYPQSTLLKRPIFRHILANDTTWRNGLNAVALVESGADANALPALLAAAKRYPNHAEFAGLLGLAYLRLGEHDQAITWLQRARQHTQPPLSTERWDNLLQTVRYWQRLRSAEAAAERGDWRDAEQRYRQAHQQNPQEIQALVGLSDSALARQDHTSARQHLNAALKLSPSDDAIVRGIERYLNSLPATEALHELQGMKALTPANADLLRKQQSLRYANQMAESAAETADWTTVADWLTQAQSLDLDDPWLSYRLAVSLREAGRADEALPAYRRHLERHLKSATSRYAEALLLESMDAWDAGRDALHNIAPEDWTSEMLALAQRLRERATLAQAQQWYDNGDHTRALEALQWAPESPAITLQLAAWQQAAGQTETAIATYQRLLDQAPDNISVFLSMQEARLAMGEHDVVRHTLLNSSPDINTTDSEHQQRLGRLWLELGDTDRARSALLTAAATSTVPEPWLYRDLGRLTAATEPRTALDWYRKGMVAAAILEQPPSEANTQDFSPDAALTRATRTPDVARDWLAQSLARETAALYQAQNPTLALNHSFWRRDGGTPGVSALRAHTTMLQFNYPVWKGTAFIRADPIQMDAGDFDTNPDGTLETAFGSCLLPSDPAGTNQVAPAGCIQVPRQRANGTAVALGWQGEHFGFDLGRTPASFPISHWVGGVNANGSLGPFGWSLRVSRRPVAGSILSLAGAQDPRTGMTWGGVLATGASAALSWDQGEAHGAWLTLGRHKLSGTSVMDNHRTQLMGGYYHRLVNRPNEQLSLGFSGMHWRFKRNLGGYTLGQGGYYSPQRYTSISVPIRYSRRQGDWSYALRAAVSHSWSRSNNTPDYPDPGLLPPELRTSLANVSDATTTSSTSWGYNLQASVERRLSNHWVAGALLEQQKSPDYAPSRFMLYARYHFHPWQGDLPSPPETLTPYVDFN